MDQMQFGDPFEGSTDELSQVSVAHGRRCCSSFYLSCRQFLLLLGKNFLLQFRRPASTVYELLFSPLSIVILVLLRLVIDETSEQCFVTFPSEPLTIPNSGPFTVYYAPNNTQEREIATIIQDMLNGTGGTVQGVASAEELVTAAQTETNFSRLFGCLLNGSAIWFDSVDMDDGVEYTIRLRHEVLPFYSWFTSSAVAQNILAGPRVSPNFYLNEGFLQLENIVHQAIVKWRTKDTVEMNVEVRQFPYPSYPLDLFLSFIASAILPLFVVGSLMYSAGVFVRELVLEKETGVRETLKMMGMSQGVLWTTWFIKEVIVLLPPITIQTLLLKYGGIYPKSDGFLIFLVLFIYLLSGISFCFFVSVWFNSARIGMIAGFVLWFVLYLPYSSINTNYDSIPLGGKVALCLFPNTCIGLAVQVLSALELRQEGLSWSNFATAVSADDSLNMGWIVLMFLVDAVFFVVLAWYIDAVKPGKYGVPKPFYFLFLSSYWTGKPRKTKYKELEEFVDRSVDATAHEDPPLNLPVGITIADLTKVYNQWNAKKRKVAVDQLNLSMYKGQITALLGHNGAGKTTTISMLTGLIPPTIGDARINGLNIKEDMDLIRRSLGICPQHNILFDRLTVTEHLIFFSLLKGRPYKEALRDSQQLVEDLQLVDKKKLMASKLSGGMKRKLSVGIALVGHSEIVILDEPTSGMDPYARRATWDLLIKHKKGRTILLTTHHMDEADLLGDRIAIMAEGKLKCSGSSFFLKNRYGVGYHMTMVKEPHCDSQAVTDLVVRMVTGAKLETDVGAELSFILPSQSSHQFPQLFDTLDECKTGMGISSFGMSVTTMEEVFMRVGTGDVGLLNTRLRRQEFRASGAMSPPAHIDLESAPTPSIGASVPGISTTETAFLTTNEEENKSNKSALSPDLTTFPATATVSSIKHYHPNSGLVLWLQQLWAMLVKRFHNSRRTWSAVAWQLLIPAAFVLYALIIAVTLSSNNGDDPKRALTLENSASSDNVTVFWAQFGNGGGDVDLSAVDWTRLGATYSLNYTHPVLDIVDGVQNHSNISVCCQYELQLLDQFCARQTEEVLKSTCNASDEFGYKYCLECLSCCNATESQLPTCSNPLLQTGTPYQAGDPSSGSFCPTPPSVAVGSNETGSLDSMNVYVAEQLLRVSLKLDPALFFQQFAAGYVVHSPDSPYSTCACQNQTETSEFLLPARVPSDTLATLSFLVSMLDVEEQISARTSFALSLFALCNTDALTVTPVNNTWSDSYNGYADMCIDLASCKEVDLTDLPNDFSNINNSFEGLGNLSLSDFTAFVNTSFTEISSNVSLDNPASIFDSLPSIETSCQCKSECLVGKQSPPSSSSSGNVSVTVWYNNQPYHMIAASLNAFYNAYISQQIPGSDFSISVNNHPLPRNLTTQIEASTDSTSGFLISTTCAFGISFLFASFIVFLVQEKSSKAKHLQFVSGVHVTSYWLGTYIWDMVNCFVPVILIFILFAAFQVDGYKEDNLAAVFLLLLLSCWSTVPLTYCFSFLFSNSLLAFGLMVTFFYVGEVILSTVELILFIFEPDVVDIVHYIFLLHPSYGIAIGLSDMYTNQIVKDVCTQSEIARIACDTLDTTYADSVFQFLRPGIGHIFLYMFVEGVFFLMLTMLIERKFFVPEIRHLLHRKNNHHVASTGSEGPKGEDSDVAAERERVMSIVSASESDAVIIKNLSKVYRNFRAVVCPCLPQCRRSGYKLAVAGMNLIIPNGECFGLLGVNGAGKTTAFKMLTGDIAPTSGTALVAGYDIRTGLRLVQQRIGYCPQFDAFIDRLTGRELLTMFARLRGIPEKEIKDAVKAEIERLDLGKHADKVCGRYSGGNRRKLSTAVALVGNPPILLLDEPTTGMDPATRRFLWDALIHVIKDGRSVILTSHSMEECEALCTRLAIMVNGQFKCLGAIQHLKSKFGSGYTLYMKVFKPKFQIPSSLGNFAPPPSPYDTTEVQSFVSSTFPGAVLLEQHQGTVIYQIPFEGVSWSQLFRQLEENKQNLNIIDYSVSQTTLEQVFINFAAEQQEDTML